MNLLRALGPVEHALTLTDQTFGLTVVGWLRLTNGPDPSVLRQALDALQRRHQVLRVGIHFKGSKPYFCESPADARIPLDVRIRTNAHQGHRVAESLLNTKIRPIEGPLMHVVYLLDAFAVEADLLFAFHHSILDAPAANRIFRETIDLCVNPENQGDPTTLLPPTETLTPAMYRGFSGLVRTTKFTVGQLRDELRYKMRTSKHQRPRPNKPSRCRIITRILDENTTAKLVRTTRAIGQSVHSMIAAAQIQSLAQARYSAEVVPARILVFSSLRPYTVHPMPHDLPGCLISVQRFTIDVRLKEPVEEFGRRFGDLTASSFRNGDRFPAARLATLVARQAIRRPTDRMSNTAISYVGPIGLPVQIGSIRIKAVHGFITTNHASPEMSLSGGIFNDRLYLSFMYQEADWSREEAELLADTIIESLS